MAMAIGHYFRGEKTRQDLDRQRRQLEYDLQEVKIQLQKRVPPREEDKLNAKKRKLEFQLQEVHEELKELTEREKEREEQRLRAERESEEQHRREMDKLHLLQEASFERNQRRRQENREQRKEKMRKYNLEASIESTKEGLSPCCTIA
ncbi:troponin T, cardiac muscle-like [Dysidea avara]|uniref:troponin T, cardiac muscle-like n=1 Tax=Dysidea avara TaxID=196820 RepID=UPI00331AA4AB